MLYLDWGWEKGFPEEMLKDGSKEMFQSSAEDSIPEGTVFAKLLEKGKSWLSRRRNALRNLLEPPVCNFRERREKV